MILFLIFLCKINFYYFHENHSIMIPLLLFYHKAIELFSNTSILHHKSLLNSQYLIFFTISHLHYFLRSMTSLNLSSKNNSSTNHPIPPTTLNPSNPIKNNDNNQNKPSYDRFNTFLK